MWFLEDVWSQFSSRSHSRVTTGLVHHINYEHDPRMFDKQKVSRYICCYFEQSWYEKCACGFFQIKAT